MVGDVAADAGDDEEFCGNVYLDATTTGANAEGHWEILSGAGGTLVDAYDAQTEFNGDSTTIYQLTWIVENNLCEEARDTMRLDPGCLLLSLNLIDFEVHKAGTNNNMYWSVSSDMDVEDYVILRSFDATNFEKIRNEYSRKSPNYEDYYFTDVKANRELNTYYKLRTTNLDGSYSYSEVLKIDGKQIRKDYKLYPNPTKDNITIESNIKFNGSTLVNVYSIEGKLITSINTSSNSKTTFTFNVSRFKTGNYIAEVIEKSGMRSYLRFTKN